MTHKPDLKIGEKVWIEPADPAVPVPYETRLRGGLFSGQRGHPSFPPNANKVLGHKRVRKLVDREQVIWSEWWRRRLVHKEIKISPDQPQPVETPKKKKGGDK